MNTHRRKRSLRKVLLYVGASAGALVLGGVFVLLIFGSAILDGYGRRKAERTFAKAHPGSLLRIGELVYSLGANRLVARSVTLNETNRTLKADRISLTGVFWARLLWRKGTLAELFAKASLDATNLTLEFPREIYGIRCARLRASVPRSELIAEGMELHPLVEDEEFFAAQAFRTPRFRVVLPECTVAGLSYEEALQGRAYRAESVHLSRPILDALINRDKLPPPFAKSPLMVHEALASIRQPLQVGNLSITGGQLTYRERLAVGAGAGVLTLGAVSLSVKGIANRGDADAAIQLRGQCELMDAGTMKVVVSIPITPPDFSLHYSGSLGTMDLTRLSAFLDIAEHTRIKSGTVQEAAFEIDVTNGHAQGRLRAIYSDLEITMLDKQTGTEKGMKPRVESLFANLKVRNANTPDGSGSRKEGKINYRRRPDDEFQQFLWFALRTGVLDIIKR